METVVLTDSREQKLANVSHLTDIWAQLQKGAGFLTCCQTIEMSDYRDVKLSGLHHLITL